MKKKTVLLRWCLCGLLGSFVTQGCVSGRSVAARDSDKPGPGEEAPPPVVSENELKKIAGYFENGNHPAVIKTARDFLARNPKAGQRPQVMLYLAESYFKSNRFEQTALLLESLIKEHPQAISGKARWLLGESYFRLGKYRPALVEYQLVYDRYPKTVSQEILLYNMGLSAFKLGWMEQAQDNLVRVGGYLLSFAQRTTLLLTRARVALALEDYHTAWQAPLDALEITKRHSFPEGYSLREEAKLFLQTLIAEKLPLKEVERIAEECPKRYPGGLAFYRLIRNEVMEGDKQSVLSLTERFMENFSSGHLYYQEVRELHEQTRIQLQVELNKIGIILPFSGKLAPFGQMVLRGIELAVEEENRGRKEKIALIIKDSQGSTDQTEQQLLELIEEEKVVAVIGPVLSKVALAVATIANEKGVPLITPAASAESIPQTGPYVFRNCLTSKQQAWSTARFAVEKMDLRSFIILNAKNAYSVELADHFTAAAEELERPVLARFTYDPADTDFRAQIEGVHKIAPEALFVADYYDKAVLIAPQIAFYTLEQEEGCMQRLIRRYVPADRKRRLAGDPLDWPGPRLSLSARRGNKKLRLSENPVSKESFPFTYPAKMFLLGTHGWYNPLLLEEGGKYLEESVFPCGFFQESTVPAINEFGRKFRERFWQEPDLLAAQAYDATNMLLSVLREGALTREEVKDELSQIYNFPGVTGYATMDENGEAEKELAMVGVKKRRFQELQGDEPWLTPFPRPEWAPLLHEHHLEELLPWSLYHLLEKFELYPPLEETGRFGF